MILPRVQDTEYDVTHHGDSFFIRTNDGAKTFRVVEAPVKNPGKPHWKEVIPGRADVTIEGVNSFKDQLVFEERDNGLIKIRIQKFESGVLSPKPEYIEFPEPVYTAGVGANAEYDTKLLRFSYTSLTTPDSVFDYNIATHERELLKQQEVLGGYDKSQYATERVFATASDGVKVPISLVYKKGLVRDGKAPCCCTATVRMASASILRSRRIG